ncbi:hypothetical protein FACS189472_12450 [Alphaproteobacteria bacterium]|nr:hypothetical protein FACS189472_12450 [Alphaproteobacteria bacterium]
MPARIKNSLAKAVPISIIKNTNSSNKCPREYVLRNPQKVGASPDAEAGVGASPDAEAGVGASPDAEAGVGASPDAEAGVGARPLHPSPLPGPLTVLSPSREGGSMSAVAQSSPCARLALGTSIDAEAGTDISSLLFFATPLLSSYSPTLQLSLFLVLKIMESATAEEEKEEEADPRSE